MAEQDLTAQPPGMTGQPKAFTVPPAPELAAVRGQMGGLPTVPDYAAKRKEFKTSADASTEIARQLQRENELGQEIGMAEQAQKEYLAGAKAGIATQAREASQRIEADLDSIRAKFPYPEFHPTQDNIQSLTGLFSIIGLIGTAMGGAGKNSALLALNSMSGMMKGWRSGRADLFKREKEEFDKNMQRVKSVLEDAYKDADRAEKMLAYNRQEAEALAAQSAAKLGGQIGKQILEKQSVGNYVKYLKELLQDFKHTEDLASRKDEARLNREAAERRHREAMAQRERLAKDKAQQSKEKGQGTAANTRYAFNMTESFGQAAQDLINITRLPRDTVMGSFAELAGKSGDSLKAGLTAALGRQLTTQDERMFSQLVAGLDQNMARTLGGGYASSSAKHMIDAYKQQIPRAGDTAGSAALFLARFRQELEIFADVFDAHPGATDRMNGKVQKYVTAVEKAIPFTVDDVLSSTRGSRQTINQQFAALATQPFNMSLPTEQGGGAPPAGPAAPAEPTAIFKGRTIVVRNGKWVYQDTGEEAK